MKGLTNGEKVMLLFLTTVIVVMGFNVLVYKPQQKEIDELFDKITEYEQMIEQHDRTADIESLNQEIDNAVDLINDKSKRFFPTIIQEKFILMLDSDLKSTNVNEASISFRAPVIEEVLSSGDNSAPASNQSLMLEDLVLKTAALAKAQETKPVYRSNSNNNVIKSGYGISFICTYDELLTFIDKIKSIDRAVAINSLSISPNSGGELLNCSIDLTYYAIPKLNYMNDLNYLLWDLRGDYGVENPFIPYSGMSVVVEPVRESERQLLDNDFFMVVQPIHSDMPTLTIGKSKDNNRTTYLTADNAETEEVSISITEKNGEFYYQYSTATKTYPPLDSMLFVPNNDEKTKLIIYSTPRTSDRDVNMVNLTITNTTRIPMEVVIYDDDRARPRVSINNVGSVNVINR